MGKHFRRTPDKGIFFLMSLTGIAVVVLYLWGRVQIDLVLRENGALGQEKQNVQSEIDVLRAQVNSMKGYQQIIEKAKSRGMVFLSTARRAELPVDLKGLKSPVELQENDLQLAGMDPFGIPWKLRPKSQQSGGKDGSE